MPRRSKKRAKLNPKQLGVLIRNARESVGLAQNVLGERAGVGKSQMCGIETGAKSPSVGTFLNICAAMGWTTSEVLREVSVPLGELERAIEQSIGVDALLWFQELDQKQMKQLYEAARPDRPGRRPRKPRK